MSQSLWIPGPLPGMNETIAAAKGAGGRGILYAAMKREWTQTVALFARAAHLQPVGGRAHFHFHWVERARKRDPDNIAAGKKYVLDGLVLARVLDGDGWEHVDGWKDTFDVGKAPGVRVTLIPVDAANV